MDAELQAFDLRITTKNKSTSSETDGTAQEYAGTHGERQGLSRIFLRPRISAAGRGEAFCLLEPFPLALRFPCCLNFLTPRALVDRNQVRLILGYWPPTGTATPTLASPPAALMPSLAATVEVKVFRIRLT